MKQVYFLTIFMITLGLVSCYKDEDKSTVVSIPNSDPPLLTTTTITGYVYDKDGRMSDYTIRASASTSKVKNPQNVFLTKCNDVNKKGQAIYVVKDEELVSMMHTQLIEHDINYLKIERFPVYQTLGFSSQSLEEGSMKIDLNTSKILTKNNTTEEQVSIKYRSLRDFPSVAQIGTSGYTVSGKLQKIIHKHAFEIRLQDNHRKNLAIDKGDVDLTIVSSSTNRHLYRFDEHEERWKHEQSLTDSPTTISISMLGFYSIVETVDATYAEGKLVNSGKGISYQELRRDYGGSTRSIYTTIRGRFIDVVETDTPISYTPYTICGSQRNSLSIEPTSTDVKGIVFRDEDPRYQGITPIVYDCDGSPIEVNALSVKDGNRPILFTSENQFVHTYACDDKLVVSYYDFVRNNLGENISVNTESQNLYIMHCDDYTEQYSFIKIRDDIKPLPRFNVLEEDGKSMIKSQDGTIHFSFVNNGVGSYENKDVNIYINDPLLGDSGYYTSCLHSTLGCGMNTWEVTHYPVAGKGLVRIKFSGSIWMRSISPAVAGNFQVEGVILCEKDR